MREPPAVHLVGTPPKPCNSRTCSLVECRREQEKQYRAATESGSSCRVTDCKGRLTVRSLSGYRGRLCITHYRWANLAGLPDDCSNEELVSFIAAFKKRSEKNANLRQTYKMSLEDYEQLLYVAQDGICPLCLEKAPSLEDMLAGRFWPVDHDHSCCNVTKPTCGQCVRGVLCHGCNKLLTKQLQTAAWLERALEYVSASGLVDANASLANEK